MYENKATPQCFKVVVENMALPVAVFLYKEHAEAWKDQIYEQRATVVECQGAFLWCSALHRGCNNPERQQPCRNGCTG
jgi:hypothetical protein